jgi:plastocyanin domain-containing protein
MYKVIDIQTGATIKTFAADKGAVARKFAHKKDASYGAVRYVVRFFAN